MFVFVLYVCLFFRWLGEEYLEVVVMVEVVLREVEELEENLWLPEVQVLHREYLLMLSLLQC